MKSLLRTLCSDRQGAVVIETAIIAPVLVLMSLGAVETSRIVARQTELQQAVGEAAEIAVAIKVDTANERTNIKNIVVASTGVAATSVTVSNVYRCGAATTTVAAVADCAATDMVTTYLSITVTDTVTPLWAQLGLGGNMVYNVNRTVLVA